MFPLQIFVIFLYLGWVIILIAVVDCSLTTPFNIFHLPESMSLYTCSCSRSRSPLCSEKTADPLNHIGSGPAHSGIRHPGLSTGRQSPPVLPQAAASCMRLMQVPAFRTTFDLLFSFAICILTAIDPIFNISSSFSLSLRFSPLYLPRPFFWSP